MGRRRIQIKKLQNLDERQNTYYKRRTGLLKMCYQLSILCDVDIALMMYSVTGKISFLSMRRSIEDLLLHCLSLPDDGLGPLHDKKSLITNLQVAKQENLLASGKTSSRSGDAEVEELKRQVERSRCELEMQKKRLRILRGEPFDISSLEEAVFFEQMIREALNYVQTSRQRLELGHPSLNMFGATQGNTQPQNAYPIGDISDFWVHGSNGVQTTNMFDANGLPVRDGVHASNETIQPAILTGGQNVSAINHGLANSFPPPLSGNYETGASSSSRVPGETNGRFYLPPYKLN